MSNLGYAIRAALVAGLIAVSYFLWSDTHTVTTPGGSIHCGSIYSSCPGGQTTGMYVFSQTVSEERHDWQRPAAVFLGVLAVMVAVQPFVERRGPQT